MALTTSGQVDWVSLTTNTITGSTAILQRLSMANVDPYTLVVAQAVSSHFKMSLLGQRRVYDAFQGLKCFSSIGNAVWFGVGVKHIIRTLAETKEGTMCLTLCASLSEVFSTELSAVLLGELASVLGLPEGSGPSLPQWEHLVVVCGGTLAATRFPCVAEHIMGLCEARHRPKKSFGSRTMSDFNDFAQALGGVVEILNGSVTSITLAGGAACGWIAAFAHWFLGLNIEVRGGDDEQEILYTSSMDGRVAISVIYENRGYGMAIQRRDTTYVLRVLDSAMAAAYPEANRFSGRVPWDRALITAFGSQARILIETQELGMMLGAAANILLAISKADPGASFHDRSAAWPGYGAMSVGFGFLVSAWNWLPELQGVSDVAEACVGEPVLLAYATFNNAKNALSNICACNTCVQGRDERDKTVPRADACLPQLGIMIIELVWSLASMHLKTPLQPSLKGLQRMAKRPRSEMAGSYQSSDSWTVPIFENLEEMTVGHPIDSIRWTAATVLGGDLPTGPVSGTRDGRSAFTNGGICFYYDILRELTDRPEAVAVLHVLPGCIQMRGGRIVNRLEDMPVAIDTLPYPFGDSQTYDAAKAGDRAGSNLSVELLIKEAVTRAFACFRLTSSRGRCYVISPVEHVRSVLAAAGRVHCNTERHQESPKLPADGVLTLHGEGVMGLLFPREEDVSAIVYRFSGNTLARCVALLNCRAYGPAVHTILRTYECLDCCIRTAQKLRDELPTNASTGDKPIVVIIA